MGDDAVAGIASGTALIGAAVAATSAKRRQERDLTTQSGRLDTQLGRELGDDRISKDLMDLRALLDECTRAMVTAYHRRGRDGGRMGVRRSRAEAQRLSAGAGSGA